MRIDYTLQYLLFFCLVISISCNSKKDSISPEVQEAISQCINMNYQFIDTLVEYKVIGTEIELNFITARDKKWNLTLVWIDEEGKELGITPLLDRHYLSDGKTKLQIPPNCLNYKGISKMTLLGNIEGAVLIAKYGEDLKGTESINVIEYEDDGNNTLIVSRSFKDKVNNIFCRYNINKMHYYEKEIADEVHKYALKLMLDI